MKGARRRPPWIYFTVDKPAWWRRYAVTTHMGERTTVIARFWSWDSADDLVEKLSMSLRQHRRFVSLARRLGAKIPGNAQNVVISPYAPGRHPCCCGEPDCTDFENRITEWGVPLDEITEVTFEVPLS